MIPGVCPNAFVIVQAGVLSLAVAAGTDVHLEPDVYAHFVLEHVVEEAIAPRIDPKAVDEIESFRAAAMGIVRVSGRGGGEEGRWIGAGDVPRASGEKSEEAAEEGTGVG